MSPRRVRQPPVIKSVAQEATHSGPPESPNGQAFEPAFAFHRLLVSKGNVHVQLGKAASFDRLDLKAREFIDTYMTNLKKRKESLGRAQSAWWNNGAPPQAIADWVRRWLA